MENASGSGGPSHGGDSSQQPAPEDRPFAGQDTLVFVRIGGRPTLAVVADAVDSVYTIVRHLPPLDAAQTPDASFFEPTERLRIDMRDERHSASTVNLPLPTCCVCIDTPSNCFLWCRCTLPCVCALCAGRLDACPQCRHPITREVVATSPYGQGNIGALGAPHLWQAMTVFARTLTGKTIAVETQRNATVRSIKESIQDDEGIPADQQRMYFNGNVLDDRLVLPFYRVEHESTIHLVLEFFGD
jgi:hypothetical protein